MRVCPVCDPSIHDEVTKARKQGNTYVEIGKTLNISESAIRSHFRYSHHDKGNSGQVVYASGQPRLEVTSTGGEFETGELTEPLDLSTDWDSVLRGFGLDPEIFEVADDTVKMSKWQTSKRLENGDRDIIWLYSYKARFTRRATPVDEVEREDIDALCREIMKRKPVKPLDELVTDRALVVLLSDWQAGKGEGGGSAAMTDRIMAAFDKLLIHLKNLEREGRRPSSVYLVGMGDLIEQCTGHYDMQAFQTDLGRRQQKRLVRRLIMWIIDALVVRGYTVYLAAVAGNHGENRNANGKAFTSWGDNDDLAVMEEVAEICAANPERYANVLVPDGAIPEDDLVMTLDIEGVRCGFAHGHQFAKSGLAQAKLENWLRGQVMGKQPVADVDLLFAGHLHHFMTSESTGRVVFQCPAMDGGSKWFTSTSGSSAPSGMLVMCVGTAYGRGWGDLQIL